MMINEKRYGNAQPYVNIPVFLSTIGGNNKKKGNCCFFLKYHYSLVLFS